MAPVARGYSTWNCGSFVFWARVLDLYFISPEVVDVLRERGRARRMERKKASERTRKRKEERERTRKQEREEREERTANSARLPGTQPPSQPKNRNGFLNLQRSINTPSLLHQIPLVKMMHASLRLVSHTPAVSSARTFACLLVRLVP